MKLRASTHSGLGAGKTDPGEVLEKDRQIWVPFFASFRTVRNRVDIADPRHTSASKTWLILEPTDHICTSFIFFIQIFVSCRILPKWQFSFPFFPLKRHLKIMRTATHHDEPHKKQRISKERSVAPLSSRTILVGISLCHCPACECWFRKSSAFAERSSRALLSNFNYTLQIANFIFKLSDSSPTQQ